MKEISAEELKRQRVFIDKICLENRLLDRKPLAFVETYGCAQNESDSERLKGMLFDMGYDFCDNTQDADLVLYNTCAVRENAEFRVFGNIGALKHLKAKRPELLIGVLGCMTQQEHIAEKIKKKYRHVDMVFGTHSLYRFPEILDEARRGAKTFDAENHEGRIFETESCHRDVPPLAKIPIMYGCNNFCTYCIVPYVRGRERSRSADNILAEVRRVAKDGYKEVMLLGQNVNSYGKDLENGLTFAMLLEEVCKIEGIERVRFMTSHPKDISEELIDTMAREKKICKQLHLPIQCGSDRILKKMNRSYDKKSYLDIVRRVREKMPDIVLSTDIIVGFPGETNEDFEETLDVIRKVQYDLVYSFIYSKRVGTPAAKMEDCLTEAEKHKNFDKMAEIQNKISKKKNDAYLGRVVEVLVEGESRTNAEYLTGRTEGGKVVNFKGDISLVGRLVKVKIIDSRTWSLMGEIDEEQ